MLQSLCCMRLNTAGIVLGWLGVVGSFVATIFLSIAMGYADVITQHIIENMQNGQGNYDEIHTVLIVVFGIYLAVCVLNLMASSLLIIGTMKERHLMLLPWLINSGIALFFNCIYHIALFVMSISNGLFGLSLLSLLILVVYIYIYYGIYSLYKQIQRTRDQQMPLMNSQGSAVPSQPNTYPSYTKI